MSIPVRAYAAHSSTGRLGLFDFARRGPRPDDVVIDIQFCGVCHSDIHQARDEWGGATFPMVPGHEIVGRVAESARRSPASRSVTRRRRLHGRLVPRLRRLRQGLGAVLREGRGADLQRHRDGPADADLRWLLDADRRQRALRAEDPARASTRPAPRRCCAPASPPTRRCASGAASPATASASSASAASGHMAVKLAAAMGAEVTVLSTSPEGGRRAPARRHGLRADQRRPFKQLAGPST